MLFTFENLSEVDDQVGDRVAASSQLGRKALNRTRVGRVELPLVGVLDPFLGVATLSFGRLGDRLHQLSSALHGGVDFADRHRRAGVDRRTRVFLGRLVGADGIEGFEREAGRIDQRVVTSDAGGAGGLSVGALAIGAQAFRRLRRRFCAGWWRADVTTQHLFLQECSAQNRRWPIEQRVRRQKSGAREDPGTGRRIQIDRGQLRPVLGGVQAIQRRQARVDERDGRREQVLKRALALENHVVEEALGLLTE
jgi:hypothetical protein